MQLLRTVNSPVEPVCVSPPVAQGLPQPATGIFPPEQVDEERTCQGRTLTSKPQPTEFRLFPKSKTSDLQNFFFLGAL